MDAFREHKKNIKDTLSDKGIISSIEQLKDFLLESSEAFKTIFLLESRYKDLKRREQQGILSYEKIILEENNIRKQLLELIYDIEEVDTKYQSEPIENEVITENKPRAYKIEKADLLEEFKELKNYFRKKKPIQEISIFLGLTEKTENLFSQNIKVINLLSEEMSKCSTCIGFFRGNMRAIKKEIENLSQENDKEFIQSLMSKYKDFEKCNKQCKTNFNLVENIILKLRDSKKRLEKQVEFDLLDDYQKTRPELTMLIEKSFSVADKFKNVNNFFLELKDGVHIDYKKSIKISNEFQKMIS